MSSSVSDPGLGGICTSNYLISPLHHCEGRGLFLVGILKLRLGDSIPKFQMEKGALHPGSKWGLVLREFKSLTKSTKNRYAASYHHSQAALKSVCHNQLLWRNCKTPGMGRPSRLALPTSLSFPEALGTSLAPFILAFAVPSLCGYLISLAKIINFHLSLEDQNQCPLSKWLLRNF